MKYIAVLEKYGKGENEYIETDDLHRLGVVVLSWGYHSLTPDYDIIISAVSNNEKIMETNNDSEGY